MIATIAAGWIRFRTWIVALVWRVPPVPEPVVPIVPKPVASMKAHAAGIEATGQWYFKRDILDRLDEYFRYLKRLKRYDEDAYALYKQVGGVVVNQIGQSDILSDIRTDFRRDQLPSFSLVFPSTDKRDRVNEKGVGVEHPRLMYAIKLKNLAQCAIPPGCSVYKCVAFFSAKNNSKLIDAVEWPVVVTPDGGLVAVKMFHPVQQQLRNRRRTSVTHMRADYPAPLISWAKEHNTPTDTFAAILCTSILNAGIWAQSGILVRCRNVEGLVAAFSIDMLRTPYFFKDRIKVKTPSGKTKKIFHIVRTFKRNSGAYVKSHFRGLRRFKWNAFNVAVTMPGLHHTSVNEFTVAAIDADMKENIRGTVPVPKVAATIAKVLNAA